MNSSEFIVLATAPPKQEGSLSETLEQDGPKRESDIAMTQTNPVNQNNLQQLRQGKLRKRQSKRRVYTSDDTNVPCSLLSRKDQKRILQWQKSRLRFDELVKESLEGTITKETQSDVKNGDEIQADRNTTHTGAKEVADGDQIQAEINMEKPMRETAVTQNDSAVEGTEEGQFSAYLSSTMNRETSVSLNGRRSFLHILKKEFKESRDVMTDMLKEEKKDEANVRYLKMMEEQYGIVERHEALLLRAIELAFSKLSKQKAEDDRNGSSMMSSGYIEMEQWQERNSFKPFYAVDPYGKMCLCCFIDPVDTENGESLIHCEILDALDAPPVVDMFEILLCHIVRVSSIPSGTWVAIPYNPFNILDWQEACLRELVEDRIWIDPPTKFRRTIRYVDQTEMHFIEFFINEKKTLAIVGRPRVDIAVVESQNVMITSSNDDTIRLSVPASLDRTTKVVHLQVVPILPQMVADFKTTYKSYDDDLDHNLDQFSLLGCSPFIILTIMDKSKESPSFTFPFRTQSSKPDSGIVLSMRPSPLTLDPTTTCTHRHMTPDSSQPRSLLGSLFTRAVVSFWAGAGENDTHIVYFNNGTTVKMKTLEKQQNGQFVSCPVYAKHARFFALETKQDMKSTKVHALATSFAEFITTKLIDVQVTQFVQSRNVLLTVLPSQNLNNDEIRKQEGVITSTHQIRLKEGSVICWTIRGNLAVVQDQIKVFAFHSFQGMNLGFQIEVVNKYTQRSLSTYVGFIQLYSLQGQRTGPLDKWVLPNIDTNWKHLLDIPLTLPKSTITVMPTSWKAPIFVPNEGKVTGKFGVDLREISARVSGDWYRLARALNLQHPRIQSIVQQNKTEDRRELAYQILLSWFKRTLQLSDKAETLVPALRRCHEWRLAEELAQRNRTNKLEKHELLQDLKMKNAIAQICQRPTVFGKWQELSCNLGLSNDDIFAISARAGDDKSCCFEALCLWKNTARSPNVRNLALHLRRCQCNVAADYVLYHFT